MLSHCWYEDPRTQDESREQIPRCARPSSWWGDAKTRADRADFDPDRAMLSEAPMFDEFYPTEYEPLSDALGDRRVDDDTVLLVLKQGGTTLTFLTMQMSYHHIAQGELAGEPWMVSF